MSKDSPRCAVVREERHDSSLGTAFATQHVHLEGSLHQLGPAQPPMLYGLERDPLETTNLASDPEYTGLLGELRERTDELRDTYGGEFDASLWRGGDGSR